jgi:[ribosomal protein S18]-alanine N-acetyltransferase
MSRSRALDPAQLGSIEPAHLDAVVELEQACHAVPWSRAMLASELERPGGLRIGAWADHDTLAGMLLAATLADAWHVLDVAVAPQYRRRGAAGAMLEELFARTASDPTRGYTLEVRASNHGAIALYEAHGFESHGRRPRYYLDGEDALVMWRPPQAIVFRRQTGDAAPWEPPL